VLEDRDGTFFLKIVYAFVLSMEARCPFMENHSQWVAFYSMQIGKKIGLKAEELKIIYYVGLVHDIGKIGTPDEILNKPARLTEEESRIIKLHPVVGAELLAGTKIVDTGIAGVRHHHERYDGKGYPDGLRGTEISLIARIISCADAYDAMVHIRPYRARPMTVDEAVIELDANIYSQFDPLLVDAFIPIIESGKVFKEGFRVFGL
jgi:putative nucleotidyltransferase with HDIG domain